MIQKAYKFRIYPNKTQEVLLSKTFGCCRVVWNEWTENFNKPKDDPTKVFRTIKEIKQEHSWLSEVSYNAMDSKAQDFREFKNQFFNKNRKKKIGIPKFKNKYSKQSFRLLDDRRFEIKDGKIRLEKIGWMKIVLTQEFPENCKLKSCTVSKDTCGDYFVSILTKQEIKELPKTGNKIGIDLGLKDFAMLSTGEVIDNPKIYRENQSKIRKLSKAKDRKVFGSRRHQKCKKRLARLHRYIQGQRSYFLHCLSKRIVEEFDFIAIEDLNVSGMLKNHNLAKSISDASWSEFTRQLTYKCNWYGKELVKVGRFFASSKTCSNCGFKLAELSLDVRSWTCPSCGTEHDRDFNASINILNKALSDINAIWT